MFLDSDKNPEILIVGAGPVGLTMAAELARHGVPSRIIDKADSPSVHSKAAGIHARTLEVFKDMGIVNKILEQGLKGLAVNFNSGSRQIARIPLKQIESPYPFVILLPQSNTEHILTDHLNGYGISIERELTLTHFEQDEERVSTTIETPDGRKERFKTSWLIGCDGAHSAIRKLAGLTFDGSPYEDQFYLADIAVEWNLPYNEIQIFLHPKGILVFFPLNDKEKRVRFVATVGPDDRNHSEGDPTIEDIQAVVDERGPGNIRVSDPDWLAAFRIHHRKVPEYRVGRVFVAGDAAHIHSPAGGQGMNTGVQDAYNLAWKLALVAKGQADAKILDSYSIEREPVARHVLKFTDRMTRMVTLKNPVLQTVRNFILSFVFQLGSVQKKITRNLSEVDINYNHSPIVYQDWNSGKDGLIPGTRAVDAQFKIASTGETKQLFDIQKDTNHQLLLFGGKSNSRDDIDTLASIGKSIQEKYHGRIAVHLIVSGDLKTDDIDWKGPILYDPNDHAHGQYGAARSCLYLIRPDGYVGYRNQPPDAGPLLAYLQKIFIK
jgi:2-polyprenyl-6-methoxyphenol hydroxylase-like FAD-dependent oxidoreductase